MWVGHLPEKRSSVTALAFAPDGRTLYAGDSAGRVLAWDVAAREYRELFRPQPIIGNRGVHNLWLTRDGTRLLTTDDGQLIDALRPEDKPLLTQQENSWGWWKYLLPDEKRVTSVEPEWRVALWDLRTGARVPVPGALGAIRDITHHAMLADGVTFLTYHTVTNELELWNFDTGEKVGALTPNGSGIRATALSPDTTTFAVGREMDLWVYDVPSRALRHKLRAKRAFRKLAFRPNGRLIASVATESAVTLWDAEAGKQLTQFDWKQGKPEAVAFAPDGLTCAAGGRGAVVVFDLDL